MSQEIGLLMEFYSFFPSEHCKIFFLLFSFLGLGPSGSYDEGVTDMICDGVKDLVNVLIKIFFEKYETKKVIYLIALLESVEPMSLSILMDSELGCLLPGMI